MWIANATTAIGKNATRFTPCALSCSYFKNIVKIGIVKVPPPIPIPATTPPIIPAIISQKIITTYQINIPTPPSSIKKIKMYLTTLLFNLFKRVAPITPPPTIPRITGQPLAKATELKHI